MKKWQKLAVLFFSIAFVAILDWDTRNDAPFDVALYEASIKEALQIQQRVNANLDKYSPESLGAKVRKIIVLRNQFSQRNLRTKFDLYAKCIEERYFGPTPTNLLDREAWNGRLIRFHQEFVNTPDPIGEEVKLRTGNALLSMYLYGLFFVLGIMFVRRRSFYFGDRGELARFAILWTIWPIGLFIFLQESKFAFRFETELASQKERWGTSGLGLGWAYTATLVLVLFSFARLQPATGQTNNVIRFESTIPINEQSTPVQPPMGLINRIFELLVRFIETCGRFLEGSISLDTGFLMVLMLGPPDRAGTRLVLAWARRAIPIRAPSVVCNILIH